ncbi:MAG: ABC transporter permease [Rhodospirillaceae bacterium]|nr:ABC transporter permease [Rhodospirillaceae bacterium]
MTTSARNRSPLLRLLFAAEAVRAAIWPQRMRPATGWAFLLPAVLLVAILVAGMAYMVDASFHELDRSTFRLTEEYSLTNYETVLERPFYSTIIIRTVLAAVIVTAITLVLAFPYAYAMVRTKRAATRKLLLIGLFLPFFIGQVVRAYGWLIVLGQEGLLNSTLTWMGLGTVKLIYTYPGVLIGLVQYMLPFAVLMLAPAVTAVPEEVELASDSLGAGWFATLWHVLLPMTKPGLVAAGVVVFTLTITDYAMPEIMGGGTSDFIASAIYDGYFSTDEQGLSSALAVLLVLGATTVVGVVFALVGVGTLGYSARRLR